VPFFDLKDGSRAVGLIRKRTQNLFQPWNLPGDAATDKTNENGTALTKRMKMELR